MNGLSFCPHCFYHASIPILPFPSEDAKGLWNIPQLIPQISQTFALPVATVPAFHICNLKYCMYGFSVMECKIPTLKIRLSRLTLFH